GMSGKAIRNASNELLLNTIAVTKAFTQAEQQLHTYIHATLAREIWQRDEAMHLCRGGSGF
ncbi:MAG: hypothetical protein Q9M22_04175, partial [Mariprofundaceae bacterium]|nr:hypothetical protein [Mariprofundaceae bacterium]